MVTSRDAKEMIRLRYQEGMCIKDICERYGITARQYHRYTQNPVARRELELLAARIAQQLTSSVATGMMVGLERLIDLVASDDERVALGAASTLVKKFFPDRINLDMSDNREVEKLQQAIQAAGEAMRRRN